MPVPSLPPRAQTAGPPCTACVLALDDRFYHPGDVKRVDFSCNSQFGSQCTAVLEAALSAAGSPDGRAAFLDLGTLAGGLPAARERLAALGPDLLVVIPCGRYRDATYALLASLITSSRCRCAVLAGPCLPDEPETALRELPLLSGVMIGDDFSSLVAVARALERGGSAEGPFPGFAWRRSDGAIAVERCAGPRAALSPVPARIRRDSLRVVEGMDRPADRYGKWLIDSSIGCPRQCIFCRTPVLARRQGGSSWSPRDAAAIASEMEEVVRAFGIDEFRFEDDNFLMPRRDAFERCHALKEEILARGLDVHFQISVHASAVTEAGEWDRGAALDALISAGLERVFVGVESGHDPTLRYFRKETTREMNDRAIAWLLSRGLVVIGGAVVFHPRSTLDQLRAEHAYFRRWSEHPRFAALSPLGSYAHVVPGSELDAEIQELGLGAPCEAEFRPADDAAARALAAMLSFRRALFPHDWLVFTVKRDLAHWQRLTGPAPDVEAALAPALASAASAALDAALAIIEAAAAGDACAERIEHAEELLRVEAARLREAVAASRFNPGWRAVSSRA